MVLVHPPPPNLSFTVVCFVLKKDTLYVLYLFATGLRWGFTCDRRKLYLEGGGGLSVTDIRLTPLL